VVYFVDSGKCKCKALAVGVELYSVCIRGWLCAAECSFLVYISHGTTG
jgi:hypothetical protein